ncbi:MAG: RDD family protein, partial [Candidatus Levyibacteriota bacterium]
SVSDRSLARPAAAAIPGEAGQPLPTARLARRVGALAYEALLLVAMAFGVGFALLPLMSPVGSGSRELVVPQTFARVLMGCALVGGAALYYGWCWSRGRRTLPQKTWRLRLVDHDGRALTWRRALLRYAAAWIGPAMALAAYAALHPSGHARSALAFVLVNYCWALFDRDGQFLHDRLAGTRVVATSDEADASPPP